MKLDLSVYLVTDSTPAILRDRDLCAVVEEALKGGMDDATPLPSPAIRAFR
jgi:thiamine-phosphate diphosphorylase/hydroxyethylthiazole kinase